CGRCSRSVSAVGGPARTWSRRTIAYSKVFSAATCRTLTWRSLFCAGLTVSSCLAESTVSNTASSVGTTATLDAIASCSSVSRRALAIDSPFGVDVDRERKHGHVHHQRGHAEAHERKGDAGERNHRQVAGDGHRQLAQRENGPGHADPAEKRLVV